MKAIIMAGGEGRRLRPISMLRPKPMVNLFDKPVMEHIIELLKKHEIKDICVTLRYLPRVVTDYFGDGSEFGVNIEYRIEEEPLGTAGGVKACCDFIKNEDFLVISGDAVCDFDLKKCINFHFEKKSPATIILCEKEEPLEYGLVLTDNESRITQFIEKPSWDRVFTNAVNTGIYILSPEVLSRIPEGRSYDFGKDLFPGLLAEGVPMYAYTAQGYWCDIGSSGAYLKSFFDVLDGNVALNADLSGEKATVLKSEIPADLKIIPPCYVGSDVAFESGVRIGPYAVIGSGSYIGANSKIEHSLIDGARIGSNSEICGSIVCRGAAIGGGCVLSEGSIIGEKSVIGSGSFIADGVLVWPDKNVESGSRVLYSVIRGTQASASVLFQGRLCGELGNEISFENLIDAGSSLSRFRKVLLMSNSTPAALAASSAFRAGICAGGAEAWDCETGFESAAAYGARHFDMGAAVFIRNRGPSVSISFFRGNGRPFTRADERLIEASLGGDSVRAPHDRIGRIRNLPDVIEAYALAAVKAALFKDKSPCKNPAFVFGDSMAALTLRRVLTILGCPEAKSKSEGVCFQISEDGFTLTAEEGGEIISPPRLEVVLALLEFEKGSGRVAVLPSSPAAIELLAQSLGCTAYRYGRDKEAEEILLEQPFFYDAVFAAARLMAGLAAKGETLSRIVKRIPEFFVSQRSVKTESGRASVMRGLLNSCSEMSLELSDGLSVLSDKGRVRISPRAGGGISISAEAGKEEIALELCDEFEKIIKKIDAKS